MCRSIASSSCIVASLGEHGRGPALSPDGGRTSRCFRRGEQDGVPLRLARSHLSSAMPIGVPRVALADICRYGLLAPFDFQLVVPPAIL